MSRKKAQPRPLFDLKSDFVDSLDNVTQEAVNLLSVLRVAVDNKSITANVMPLVVERMKALEAALMGDQS